MTTSAFAARWEHSFVRFAAFVCLGLSPLSASAQQAVVNWPVPVAARGMNPATLPTPKNDCMTHFQRNLDRTRQGNVDLVFDGDSLTDFWMGAGKEVWTKNYGRLNAVDYGLSGDRTENLLWRLQKGEVAGLRPRLVVLLIGTNNTGECTDAQVAEGITAVVREYQKACPMSVILLHGVFPRSESATDPLRAKIKNINAIISKVGDGKKVIYMDLGDKFLQSDGTLNHDLMPDFLHPNSKGYEVWADAIRPVIEKVFATTGMAR